MGNSAVLKAQDKRKKEERQAKKHKWRPAAQSLAYQGAVDITGTPVERFGDTHPAVHPRRLDGTRAAQDLATFVGKKLQVIAGFLSEKVNARMHKARRGPSSLDFCPAEILAILEITLERVNNVSNTPSLMDYFALEDRLGWWKGTEGTPKLVSRHRFYKFRSLLDFDPHELTDVLNGVLLQDLLILRADESVMFIAGDESMVPGDFPWSVFVPRKPTPMGVRLYLLVCRLPITGRPVVLYILPDFAVLNDAGQSTGAVHTPKLVLQKFEEWFLANRDALPRYPWITVDALFSYPDMLQQWATKGLYGSMALRPDLYPGLTVVGHQLEKGHHRIIDVGGRFLLTVYQDKKLVATATTGFFPTSLVSSDPPDRSLAPVLSHAGGACLRLLQEMEPRDLRHIMRLSGYTSVPETAPLALTFTRQPQMTFSDVPVEQLRRAGPFITELWRAYLAAVGEEERTATAPSSSEPISAGMCNNRLLAPGADTLVQDHFAENHPRPQRRRRRRGVAPHGIEACISSSSCTFGPMGSSTLSDSGLQEIPTSRQSQPKWTWTCQLVLTLRHGPKPF